MVFPTLFGWRIGVPDAARFRSKMTEAPASED
jgi:hypothetical protein